MLRQLGFVVLDVVLVGIGIELVAWLVRVGIHPSASIGLVGTTLTALAALFVAVAGAYLCGLDDPALLLDRSAVVLRGGLIGALSSLAMLLVSHYVWFQALGRISLLLTGFAVTVVLVGWRLYYARFLERGPRVPVVVLGDGPQERRFAEALDRLAHTRLWVVGLLHDDQAPAHRPGFREPASPGAYPVPLAASSPPVLGRLRDAPRILPSRGVSGAIVLDTTPMSDARVAVLCALQAHGIRIATAGTVWMNATRRLPLDLVDTRWVLSALEQIDRPIVGRAKRVVDLSVAVLGLVVMAPLWPLLWLLVRLDSPGPVIFAQSRVGHRGRVFELYKIRTMTHQAGERPARWAQPADDRVTRLGRVIRRLRIDELPQLYNVLRGDMSLVGPRPEQPAIVRELRRHIALFDYRHLVKPGITGWAQIHHGYAASVEASAIKLSYDLYYVSRHGLAMDLDIILRTLFVMLARIGAR